MRIFYEEWQCLPIGSPLANQLQQLENKIKKVLKYKAFVDIVVRNYDSPMGVATYKTKQDMPEELQKALPDLDKMKDLFCKSL